MTKHTSFESKAPQTLTTSPPWGERQDLLIKDHHLINSYPDGLGEYLNACNVDVNYRDSERDHKLSGKRRSTQILRGNADLHNTLHITTNRGRMTRFTDNSQETWVSTLLVISSSIFGKSATAKGKTMIEIHLRNWMHKILRYLFSDCTSNLTRWIWKTCTGGIAKLPACKTYSVSLHRTCNNHLPVDYIPNLQVTDRKQPVDTLQIFYT